MENKDLPQSFEQLMADEYHIHTDIPVHDEQPPHLALTNKPSTVSFKSFTGSQALTEYQRLQKKYGDGITTGFTQIDEYFRFLPGQIYLLSASTHVGKTMMALNMSAYITMTGKKVLYVSLEQGVFVAGLMQKIVGDNFPDTFTVLDTTQMVSVADLLAELQDKRDMYDLLIIDHIHFLKKSGKGATEDIDEIIHGLQNMAKELEVPMLVIAHLRKLNNQDRPPTMDDLRDSSSLSQVPSVVMMLHRDLNEDQTLKDQGVLFIRKNRIQGKTGPVPFMIAENIKVYFNEMDYMTSQHPPRPYKSNYEATDHVKEEEDTPPEQEEMPF